MVKENFSRFMLLVTKLRNFKIFSIIGKNILIYFYLSMYQLTIKTY